MVKVDTLAERFDQERLTLETLGQGPVPVPEIVVAVAGSPSVLALGLIAGTPLTALAVDATDEAWLASGAALRELHRQPRPPGLPLFGRGGEQWASFVRGWALHERGLATSARAKLGDAAVDALCDQVERTLAETVEFPSAFLHGDCQPAHVLLDEIHHGSVAGLVDLGDASVGDPAWDVAVLTLNHQARLPAVLAGYGSTDLTEHVERVGPAYTRLRLLGAVTWMEEHGFSADQDLAALAQWTS